MNFCQYCGTQLEKAAHFCPNCGAALEVKQPTVSEETPGTPSTALLTKLSERVKINGIIWIVIAAIQLIIGIVGAWFVLIVGALNLLSAIGNIKYSNRILNDPTNIVKNAEPLISPIITLVYNAVIGGVVGAAACVKLMVTIFPWWAGWFNLENIWNTATSKLGYTGAGDWNRLTAVPIAWNEYLLTWPQKLFGLGLGNCDFSPIAGMTSPYYDANWTNNYYMFSSGLIMLETGLVGMITYVGFFLMIFVAANSLLRSGRGDEVYCQLAEVLSLMSLVLFIYNCTLRTEVGYMLYFALALAFMEKKKTV